MADILIFGGTFDPPHKGHRHLLETALRQKKFDRVLVIPAYIPPHKSHDPALSFENRLGVLRAFFSGIEGLEISDLEQKLGGRSYTVNTVRALRETYPADTLHLLIGSDMFLSFDRWYRAEELLQELILVVGSRETGDRPQLVAFKEQLEKNYSCKGILICEMEALVCASSTLRGAGGGKAGHIMSELSRTLDEKRLNHTLQVASYAERLASSCGADPEKAYLAGLLHDCTKCFTHGEQLDYAAQHGISFNEHDLQCPQVLHQYTGAVCAKERFGITDPEILSAIACHTTGKCGFSPLEMLLFFCDSCEPSRRYPQVEELRRVGEKDLAKGTLMLFDHVISFIKEKKQYLHPKTLDARNYLLKELEKNG